MNPDSLRKALPRALQLIGRVVRIDHLVIIEKTSSSRDAELTPQIFFIWNSEEAPQLDAGAIIAKSHAREAMEAISALMTAIRSATGRPRRWIF